MKYKNIHIESFRGIKNLDLNDLTRVNILLGQNNSGKSSILEAIFLLTGCNPALVLNIDIFRNLMHNEEEDFRFIFYNLDYNSKPLLFADLHEKKSYRKLEIIPKNFNATDQKIAKKINAPNIGASATSEISDTDETFIQKKVQALTGINALEFKVEMKEFQTEKKTFSSSLILNRTNTGIEYSLTSEIKKVPGFKALIQNVNYRNTIELSKRIENIIVDKRKSELIEGLKGVEGKISDIITSSNSMIYVDIGAKRMIPSNLMGDGFLKFLNIIANFDTVKDGVLLIDEFDNGLHFKTLKKLWKIVLLNAKKLNAQLFITTHSKEALINLKEVLEEDDMQEHQQFVKCYTLSKHKDDTLKAFEYNFESFEYAINHEVEIRGEI